MAGKNPRKANGGFELSQAPSHLLRRCVQYANDLFSRESSTSDLTKQQFTVLAAVEQNEGISQTDLVGLTGIDRSTLAEMIRRTRGCDRVKIAVTEWNESGGDWGLRRGKQMGLQNALLNARYLNLLMRHSD